MFFGVGMPRQQEAPAAVLEGPKDSAREEEGRDTLSKSKPARDPVSSAVEASLARVSKSSEASASRQSDVGAPPTSALPCCVPARHPKAVSHPPCLPKTGA